MTEITRTNSSISEQLIMSNDMPLASDTSPYRATFWFTAFYYMIAHGRIHLVLPFLTSIPCAMISGILAVAAYLVESGKVHDKHVFGREEKLVLGLVLMCFVTLPTALWPGGSVSALVRGFLPTVILMLITIRICRTIEDIKKFVWVYVFNCLLIIGVSLSSDLNHFSKGVTDTYDVNDIAMVLDCSLPIMFYFMLQNQGIKRYLLLGCCALAVITVVLTGSRGGVLGLLAFGGYLIANSQNKVRYLLLVGAALIPLVIYSPESTKERVVSMYNPQTEYDKNLGDRTFVWKRGVGQFLSSPILGTGIGNYSVADGKLAEFGGWRTAHNSLLQIAVELGIIGLVLFVKLTAGTFLKLRMLRRGFDNIDTVTEELWIIKGVEASLLIYMATALFLSQAYNNQFYFIIALAVATQKILARKEFNNSEISLGADTKGSKPVTASHETLGWRNT